MEKKCSSCGETKPITQYQKRSLSKDGLTASCKACLKLRDAKRFQNDPRVRERNKKYQQTDAGKAAMKKANLKWRTENPDDCKASKKRWVDANPEKRAAHVLLGNRVRDGKVSKPDRCQECGASGRIHGHHEDYARPLEVDWLCATCHAKRHK